MKQNINYEDYITLKLEPCNKHDPYLQWEHIAIWHFKFTIMLLTREAIEQLGGI